MMALYQCLLLGAPTPEQVASFSKAFDEILNLFELKRGRDYTVERKIHDHFCELTATVAVFFGAAGADYPEAAVLTRLGVPVVPIVSSPAQVATELPLQLRSINALIIDPADTELRQVASAALQCLGLLPSQRRVFISYRRDESAEVALQLFEALSARHFEVFLDTHSISVAAEFQATLWHRLCDSDVLVMLDTPGYFNSRWTVAEWGRAVAKQISMLQLMWPGHEPGRNTGLATLKRLSDNDFIDQHLNSGAVGDIALELERVRSRSIALRHAHLVGTLRTAIEDLGGSVEGVGLKRSVLIKLPSGNPLVAYPIVGVPTSMDIHACMNLGNSRAAALVYDHLGIHDDWVKHMDWLAQRIPDVKWIRSREAVWHLADIGV